MRHLHILCEGQTEEILVQDVLKPHFVGVDTRVTYSIIATNRPHGSPYDRVRHVESALAETIGHRRFLPNLVLHEAEAWVLADCRRLGEVMGDPGPAAELERIVQVEPSPELINDGVDTAPSKRIKNAYPQYEKTLDGPLVIADAGLDAIRSRCPHADDWLREIEARMSQSVTQ